MMEDDVVNPSLPVSLSNHNRPAYFYHPAYNYTVFTPMHRNALLLAGSKVQQPVYQQQVPLPQKGSWVQLQPPGHNHTLGHTNHHHHLGHSGQPTLPPPQYHLHPLFSGASAVPQINCTLNNSTSAVQMVHHSSPSAPPPQLAPQRSQNIQIANTSFANTQQEVMNTGSSLDVVGSSGGGSSTSAVNNWISPDTLHFENRLVPEDSLYSTLVQDLNSGGLSNDDILEYLPTSFEDSKRSSEPSDSTGLMWELDPDIDDRVPEKVNEDKLWSQPMDFDVHSVFKTDIKSELLSEPTLAELNANEEDSSVLDGFDVNTFLMDSLDKKDTLSQSVPNYQPGQPLPILQEIKVEAETMLTGTSAPSTTWNASFVDSMIHQNPLSSSLSQSSGLHTLSSTSASQLPQQPSTSSNQNQSTFLNPLPAGLMYNNLSSSLPSTSGHPLKQHTGGGKATSRSFLHPGSPSNSPARKSPLGGGKPKGSLLADRLSTSAPSTATMEQLWKARKAEVQGAGRLRHGSTDTTLSQLSSVQLTMDEGFSSQADEEDESDNDDHSSGDESGSDNELDGVRSPLSPTSFGSAESGEMAGSSGKKKGKYFWQYNVQAKGPKGPRMKVANVPEDPHVLTDVTDPVFSPDCQLEAGVSGVKHAGKARRGDGNDLTPNPNKLYSIGLELKKLNRVINELTPPTDLPFNARNKSRKEKNKLASRACRLKKKAQHEANKLKLYGLQQEHRKLLDASQKMKQMYAEKANGTANAEEHKVLLEALLGEIDSTRVAGHSAEFVNKILSNLSSGVSRGGIDNS